MFYLTTHSTHFIYGYMASNIWLRTILIVRKETHSRHIGYFFRLTARVLLYAPSMLRSGSVVRFNISKNNIIIIIMIIMIKIMIITTKIIMMIIMLVIVIIIPA